MLRFRSVSAAVALVLLMALGVGACGSTSTTSKSTSAGGSATATASNSATPAAQCASAGTRHFQKSRLVADLGLAYGGFHRYLYKPYRAGTFRKGASGRTAAIIKATAAGAAIAKLMKNAAENAQADPKLCKYVPSMSAISTTVRGLARQLTGGAAAAGVLAHSEGLFAKLKSEVGFTGSGAPLPGVG